MKLRDPGKKLAQDAINKVKRLQAMDWQSFTVTLITPMLGGGVVAREPDRTMPVRATAIRGQLRYWWRFLARNGPDKLEGEELFNRERTIWGGMAEEGEDCRGKVRIRIRDVDFDPERDVKPCAEYKHKNNQSDHKRVKQYKSLPKYDARVPPYAMFPGRGSLKNNFTEIKEDPAELIYQLKFDLELACENKELFSEEILPALRWWATFGGLGSRTRRGAGAVMVTDKHEKVLVVPSDEESRYHCKIEQLQPVESATKCWKQCVEILQQYRQVSISFKNSKLTSHGIGRKKHQDGKPSQSNWPEANAIRTKTQDYIDGHRPKNNQPICFPRARFGMPIEFQFKSDGDKPGPTRIVPYIIDTKGRQEIYERMASPLILKPVARKNREYVPTALLLPYSYIDDCRLGIRLQYDKPPANRRLPQGPWDFSFPAWQCTDNAKPIQDLDPKGDALTAFMKFFAKGGRHD